MKRQRRWFWPWKTLIVFAILPYLAFLLTSLLGGSQYLEVFTQTKPIGLLGTLLAALHVASYLALVVATPILLIGSILLWIGRRLGQSMKPNPPAPSNP